MGLPRTSRLDILRLSATSPGLVVVGPRQAGTTTLLRQAAATDRAYVTLDDPAARELARTDPRGFLKRHPPPVLIEEIQYAPELLPYVKIAVDEGTPDGAFWLTGSQQFHLMRGVSESLAGRVAVMQLLGFSQRERSRWREDVPPFLPTGDRIRERGVPTRRRTVDDIHHDIWMGSFPGLITAPDPDPERFFSSYLQTYLLRDVRDLAQVGDIERFHRFVRACAARTAQLLNLSDLARDVDVSVPTAKSWLSVLEQSFMVYLLRPYSTNVTKRLIKAPKLYFLDTGLAAHLTGWSSPQTLGSGAMAGALLETYVVADILKSWWHRGRSAPLYYYRDKDKVEVDVLIDYDGHLHPIEIKHAATARRDWTKPLQRIEALDRPRREGVVIYLGHDVLPLDDRTVALPVSAL